MEGLRRGDKIGHARRVKSLRHKCAITGCGDRSCDSVVIELYLGGHNRHSRRAQSRSGCDSDVGHLDKDGRISNSV